MNVDERRRLERLRQKIQRIGLLVRGRRVCRVLGMDGLAIRTLAVEVTPVPGSPAAAWFHGCLQGGTFTGRVIVDGQESETPPRLTIGFEVDEPLAAVFELKLDVAGAEGVDMLEAMISSKTLTLAESPARVDADDLLRARSLSVDLPTTELRRFLEAIR